MNRICIIRQYRRARFTVIVEAMEETDLDISYDETSETRDNLESGIWVAFCARARVLLDGREIASDYLGNCIYADYRDFAAPHGYFQGMVRNVCTESRKYVKQLQSVKLRA